MVDTATTLDNFPLELFRYICYLPWSKRHHRPVVFLSSSALLEHEIVPVSSLAAPVPLKDQDGPPKSAHLQILHILSSSLSCLRLYLTNAKKSASDTNIINNLSNNRTSTSANTKHSQNHSLRRRKKRSKKRNRSKSNVTFCTDSFSNRVIRRIMSIISININNTNTGTNTDIASNNHRDNHVKMPGRKADSNTPRRRRKRHHPRRHRQHRPPKSCSLLSLAYAGDWQQLSQCAPYYSEELTDVSKHGNAFGSLPLHIACGAGSDSGMDIYVLRALLQAAPSTASICDNEGSTPLHFLLHYGCPKLPTLRLLIEAHIPSISRRDMYGRTPLFHAVDGSLSIDHLKLLLELGGMEARESILQPCGPTTAVDGDGVNVVYASPLSSRGRYVARQRAQELCSRPERGRTPLYIAWHNVFHHCDDYGNDHTGTDTTIKKKKRWNKAMLLLQAAYEYHCHCLQEEQGKACEEGEGDREFQMLHAVIALRAHLPTAVLEYALQQIKDIDDTYMDQVMHADRHGMLPLHIAAVSYLHTTHNEKKSRNGSASTLDSMSEEDHDCDHVMTSIMETLINAYPQAVTMECHEGRLALHYAIESGMTWNMPSFQFLLRATSAHPLCLAEHVRTTVDAVTGLYPFLLAAAATTSAMSPTSTVRTRVTSMSRSGRHSPEQEWTRQEEDIPTSPEIDSGPHPDCYNDCGHDHDCNCSICEKEERHGKDMNMEEFEQEKYESCMCMHLNKPREQSHAYSHSTPESRKLDTIFELLVASPEVLCFHNHSHLA